MQALVQRCEVYFASTTLRYFYLTRQPGQSQPSRSLSLNHLPEIPPASIFQTAEGWLSFYTSSSYHPELSPLTHASTYAIRTRVQRSNLRNDDLPWAYFRTKHFRELPPAEVDKNSEFLLMGPDVTQEELIWAERKTECSSRILDTKWDISGQDISGSYLRRRWAKTPGPFL